MRLSDFAGDVALPPVFLFTRRCFELLLPTCGQPPLVYQSPPNAIGPFLYDVGFKIALFTSVRDKPESLRGAPWLRPFRFLGLGGSKRLFSCLQVVDSIGLVSALFGHPL